MGEILAYDTTLDVIDPGGEKTLLTRKQLIGFLQHNIVAIHGHAWSDGELHTSCHCQPGMPVDFYEDGSRPNVLTSLREAKNRGDVQQSPSVNALILHHHLPLFLPPPRNPIPLDAIISAQQEKGPGDQPGPWQAPLSARRPSSNGQAWQRLE